MRDGVAVAKQHLHLGRHGIIEPGQEVPKTYVDSLGDRKDTDFDRLEKLGLVEDAKPSKAKPDGRKRKADPVDVDNAPALKETPPPTVPDKPEPPPDPKPQAEAESHRADSKGK